MGQVVTGLPAVYAVKAWFKRVYCLSFQICSFFVESSLILISRSICQLKKRKVIFTQDYAGSYSMIIEEVEADARNLQRASFKHENCASNSEVHRLARLAVSSSLGRQVWLLQPPGGLSIPNNVYDQ
jgi:uncharacterized protein VirK/YbjX